MNLENKRVLVREDFNVPIREGIIQSDLRLKAAVPGLQAILSQKPAKLILMSHLGRPTEGTIDETLSLKPVASRLSELLQQAVAFHPAATEALSSVFSHDEQIILLENVRFNQGEKKNEPALSKKLAALCDVFIMDAFATAHRIHASTYGVAEYAPLVCAGPLLVKELNGLNAAFKNPAKPLLAIIGGAKVSTKLGVLSHLLTKVDQLIIGGGMANTFLSAKGFPIGHSLCEVERLNEAKQLLIEAKKRGIDILLPHDVTVGQTFSEEADAVIKSIDAVGENDLILDIGPSTLTEYQHCIANAATILWNGPVGAFELTPFAKGTMGIAQAIAKSSAFSIAGGGDTLAAIEKAQVLSAISYMSTGGGAFLEYVEGKCLPGIDILEARGKHP